ncbi:MAG: hypothetical protein JXR37_35160 [Kiritimatiellae bacterium]|nr:hypothetical protein [Kiritimatiellia bacterium]
MNGKSCCQPASVPRQVPLGVHRWNFWVSGVEAALYIAALQLIGPMTLIPFLFKRAGINSCWLGLFTMSMLITSLGSPFGAAMAGGREWKKPFCVRTGALQRLPFVLFPLGVMLLFDAPIGLLVVLVGAYTLSFFFCGITGAIWPVVITNGTRETSWGKLMSIRDVLGAALGLAMTSMVWTVNRSLLPPANYIFLGWLGVGLLFVSLYVASRFREVPLQRDRVHSTGGLFATIRRLRRILREDRRVGWLALGRVLRSFGFFVGTYMTAMFIDRCGLTDKDMWIPVLAFTIFRIVTGTAAGWFVDYVGAKPALVLSAALVSCNALILFFAGSIPAFLTAFFVGSLCGSLLESAWVPLLVRLAPSERAPDYLSTLALTTAPGLIVVSVLGILLVRLTGYGPICLVSCAGTVAATLVFFFKVPHIRRAPVS